MIPSYSTANSDNESLQADVMRFMAIIAFCLIAILALVKDVEPPVPESKPAPTKPATITAAPAPIVEPAEPEPVKVLPAWQSPIEQPAPEALQMEPTRKPAPEQPRLEISEVTRPEPTRANPSQAEQTAAEDPQEQGLSLRFASAGDFLRLIARGQVKVYAFNNTGDVLGLDPSYEFLRAHTPGQVYELLPATIPSLIVEALARSRGDQDSFSWGITLPETIENRITGYLASVPSGELVIDRYGEVHHVAHKSL